MRAGDHYYQHRLDERERCKEIIAGIRSMLAEKQEEQHGREADRGDLRLRHP